MLRCVQFLSFPFHIVSVQSKASNYSDQIASLMAVPAVITSSSTSTPTPQPSNLAPLGFLGYSGRWPICQKCELAACNPPVAIGGG